MENENYNSNKLEIYQQKQELALEKANTIESNANLTPVSFINANYGYVKIRDRKNELDFGPVLGLTMSKINGLGGFKYEIDDFNKEDIKKMLLTSYNDLTIEEVYKAFELERYGDLDPKTEHFNLFNAVYVGTILKKYKVWRQNTKMQHNIGPKTEIPEISESAKKEIIDNAIVRIFNEFSETGVMPEPCVHVVDELYERKIIRDAETDGEKAYYAKVYNLAKKEIEAEVKSANVSSKTEHRSIKEELDKISVNKSDKVVLRVKRIILTDYFNKLIKQGIDIKNVIR